MRRLRALIGMPVVVRGRRIGRVVQAELSDDLTRLEGVWADAGFRGTRFIASDCLEILGSVAVIADDCGVRRPCRSGSLFRRAVGTNGRRLGAVTGAEVDELTFLVGALELTGGLWDDLLRGRVRIEKFTVNRENGDVIADVAEREATEYEERHDERADRGRADRRLSGGCLRRSKLADCEANEPADEEDRPVDFRKDR